MTDGRWNLREKQDARNVQYPGLTLGQQPVKSNMRTFCLHEFCTGTSGQDVCICLKENTRDLEIHRNSGKYATVHWRCGHSPKDRTRERIRKK